MVKKKKILFSRNLFIMFLIGSFFLLFEIAEGSNPPQQRGKARFKSIKKWKGEIHYKLDLNESFYDNSVTFLKLKGLYGKTVETVRIDGTVTFRPLKRSESKLEGEEGELVGWEDKFVGQGKVKYNVSILNISKLGEAVIVYMTDGKGSEKIEPEHYINNLQFNYSRGTYSLRITPGIDDVELGESGVGVESYSRLKITKALINKMEDHNRKIAFPELLKEMFPEAVRNPSRESIAAEAFEIALPSSGYTLKGSYKNEKGGIVSWRFVPVK